jgi:CRP-like cAMP-binding protein
MESAASITNRILLALPRVTLQHLLPYLELQQTRQGQIVDHVGGPVNHLYFVNRGMVSLVKTMLDGRTVEVASVGPEGMTDPNVLFGIDTALLEAVVQVPGSAIRVPRVILRQQMAWDETLSSLIEQYSRFVFHEVVQTAACNRLHTLQERCSRWLLTAHDSAIADSFPLTHEFFAMMLGVNRARVSLMAGQLREAGMIHYRRGRVTILDRAALEQMTCECHRVRMAELNRLFSERRPYVAN